MTHLKRYFTATALLGAVALTGSDLASAQPQSPARHATQCFYSSDWGNWTAADAHTMYLRVRMNQIYRVDFASSCPMITQQGVHLITRFEGSNSICSPIDIDLKVSDGNGIAEPCIVSGLTQLTPDEIAALPKKQVP